MLDLNLHGGTVEDSENTEFFLGPSTLVEGGAVLL